MAKVEEGNLVTRLRDDMKTSLTVSEVFERYYSPLRKVKSDSYTAICPFHSDTNDGNFHVSDSKNIYKFMYIYKFIRLVINNKCI